MSCLKPIRFLVVLAFFMTVKIIDFSASYSLGSEKIRYFYTLGIGQGKSIIFIQKGQGMSGNCFLKNVYESMSE